MRHSSNARDPALVKRGDARVAGVKRLLDAGAHNAVPGHLNACMAHAWGADRTLVMLAVDAYARKLRASDAANARRSADDLLTACREAMCL